MIYDLIVVVLVVRGTHCIPENAVIQLTDCGVWLMCFFFTASSMSGSFHYIWALWFLGEEFLCRTGGLWRRVSRCRTCSSSLGRTRPGTLVRVSTTTSGADPTLPDHQQHCEPPHDFPCRGPCQTLRVPQPADGQRCWAECGVLRHGFCGSRLHAFRWRRVVVFEPRRRLRHRLHGALLCWSRHRDHSDLWLNLGVISRCLINGRISSPWSMLCEHSATLLSACPHVADHKIFRAHTIKILMD